MGGRAVGHDLRRARQPGLVAGGLKRVQERGGALHVVLQHAAGLRSPDHMAHPLCLVPRLSPDSLQRRERQGVALGPVEHCAGAQERRGQHRVPAHVGGAIHRRRRPLVPRGLELRARLLEHGPLVVARRVTLPPQHVLARVVLHLACVRDVVYAADEIELLRGEHGPRLFRRPGPVVAVIVRPDVGILGGEEDAGRAIR